jgi:Protein of unknown function (DUF3175)
MGLTNRSMPKVKTAQRAPRSDKYWSAEVTRSSDALDLQDRVFTWRDPKRIARSLKSSAEASERRKAGPYQAAMSMLNLYINRAGKNLSQDRRRVLEQAKIELHRLFGRS